MSQYCSLTILHSYVHNLKKKNIKNPVAAYKDVDELCVSFVLYVQLKITF